MENIQIKIQELLKLFNSNKIAEAEILNKKLIKEFPKAIDLYNLLGLIFLKQKKATEAIKYFSLGIEIKSDYFPLYDNMGTAYRIIGKYDEAEKFFKKAISINKKAIEPRNNLASLFSIQNKSIKAITYYKKVLSIKSDYYITHYNLGIEYKSMGSFNDAKKHLNQALKINKYLFQAHRAMSELTKYTKNDKSYKNLEELYKNPNIKKENKTELLFALGKASEDVKDYTKAFNYYKEGNDLRDNEVSFNLKKEIETFKQIKEVFNEKILGNNNFDKNKDKSPIFVLGMPRSGTSLIEQIVSSHKLVYGGGELNFLSNLIKENIISSNKSKKTLKLSNKSLINIAKQYINNIKNISNSSKFITDKHPINFKWIGLIKIILPNAKIIHCYREPKDNCLSIYKNYFVNPELSFSNNLENICKFYNLYSDLMNFWKKNIPNFIIDVKYENIVKNPNDEIKKIIKSCNLEWDKNCLYYYKNKRSVKTVSDTQVRKKIYKTSLNSWSLYKDHLEPIFQNFLRTN
jgi:tetratricopeptide (TPR) repeat protein